MEADEEIPSTDHTYGSLTRLLAAVTLLLFSPLFTIHGVFFIRIIFSLASAIFACKTTSPPNTGSQILRGFLRCKCSETTSSRDIQKVLRHVFQLRWSILINEISISSLNVKGKQSTFHISNKVLCAVSIGSDPSLVF